MAEQIISASGVQHGLVINSDGSLNISQIIGSVNITLGSKSWNIDTTPTSTDRINPHFQFIYINSGTATGITGSEIGSVIQFIGAGSYVQKLTYSNNNLTNVGSWT